MNSSRNKKLLACFCVAMGLSTNSVSNASARLNQIIDDIKYILNIRGTKYDERKGLNTLDENINTFLSDLGLGLDDDAKICQDYIEYCQELYQKLYNLCKYRNDKDYDSSKLFNSLGLPPNQQILKNGQNVSPKGKILANYPINKEDWDKKNLLEQFEAMHKWLKEDVLDVKNGIKHGLCSSWSPELENTLRNRLVDNTNVLDAVKRLEEKQNNREKKQNKIEKIKNELSSKNKFFVNSNPINKNNNSNSGYIFELSEDKFNNFKQYIKDINFCNLEDESDEINVKIDPNYYNDFNFLFKSLTVDGVKSLELRTSNGGKVLCKSQDSIHQLQQYLEKMKEIKAIKINGEYMFEIC